MRKLLSKMFGRMANRWLMSVLGLLLLAALIWFTGPLLAIAGHEPLATPLARLIVILAVVFLWGAWNLALALRQRKTNAAVVASLAEAPQPTGAPTAASPEEVATLRERFRDALTVLKQTKLGGGGRFGRRYVYQLPWYLLIGPPGSGKTTALANSGLRFPLADRFGKEGVKGVGGTRNCDWFFTDEAVLLDTAGRYTTQDSDEATDRSAWQGFLDLLKRYRRRRPIDGVIVVFSAAELAQDDAGRRLLHAQAVKRRIQELHATLHAQAPIYVLFTKGDLIAGFTEFFDDLSREEREQVWGTTFPIAASRQPSRAIEGFPGDFQALLDRLAARLVTRLDRETDIARRGLLLSFPRQLALLQEAIHDFLTAAFGVTRFEEPGLLRGVYLSSATQQGTPIDRIIGSVASAFGLDRQAIPAFSGHGRSLFLTRLLREVVFQESGLVTETGFVARNRPWLLRGAYAAAVLLTAGVVAALAATYARNSAYVERTDAAVDPYGRDFRDVSEGRAELPRVLAALSALRSLPGGYAEREQRGGLAALGLDQEGKLGEAGDDAYIRGLNRLLLPRLARRLEQQIRDSFGQKEFLYEALKTYLMLATPERRDPALIRVWIGRDFGNQYPGVVNEPLRQEFAGHLDALLQADAEPAAVDQGLVADARRRLLTWPLAQRVYSLIKAENAGPEGGWSLAQQVSPAQLRFFRRRSEAPLDAPIPRLFTVDGYRSVLLREQPQLVKRALDDAWVYGPEYQRLSGAEQALDLTRTVSDLYFEDYIRLWEGLSNDIEIAPVFNIEQQAGLVRAMAQPDSPLKAVLAAIDQQTTLSGAGPGVAQAAAAAGTIEKTIGRLLGSTGEASAKPVIEDPAVKVDRQFAGLHKLMHAGGQGAPPIDRVLAALGDLAAYLRRVEISPGQDPKETLADFREVLAKVDAEAVAAPAPLRGMVQGLAQTSTGMAQQKVGGEAAKRLNTVYGSTVAPECRSAIAGRYPFVRSSGNDVALADFGRFFGPGGTIDKFSTEFIQPLADTSARPWRWNKPTTGDAGLSQGSLAQLERAARIRQTFFRGGEPSVSFELEPLSLDQRASQVTLELGDQRLVYSHGPRLRQRFRWPTSGTSIARISFAASGIFAGGAEKSQSGAWALFRLLDEARVDRGSGGDRLQVTFEAGGMSAEFTLIADSVVNPFSTRDLQEFRCQDSL